jgi:Uma2 family endonuclease
LFLLVAANVVIPANAAANNTMKKQGEKGMSTAGQIEPRYLTLDEFMARPDREDDQREELLEGELVVSPGPKVRHADIVWRLRRSLALLEETGAFVIANDFSCVLRPRSMPIPGLGVVRREPWEQALRDDTWLEGAPALVIEVSSPSNRSRTLMRKAGIYLDHGAEQVWIVYPKSRSVAVLTAEETREAREGEMLEFHGVRVPVSNVL